MLWCQHLPAGVRQTVCPGHGAGAPTPAYRYAHLQCKVSWGAPKYGLTRAAAHHSWVNLHSDDLSCPLQELNRQIPCSWSNLKDHVCALNSCFVDYGLDHQWIFEYMLALALQELHACMYRTIESLMPRSLRSYSATKRPVLRHTRHSCCSLLAALLSDAASCSTQPIVGHRRVCI